MKSHKRLFLIEKAIDSAYESAYNFRVFRENIALESYKKLSYILSEVIVIIEDIVGGSNDFMQLIMIANQHLENRDYIGVADSVEYEIIPVFKDIRSYILLDTKENQI